MFLLLGSPSDSHLSVVACGHEAACQQYGNMEACFCMLIYWPQHIFAHVRVITGSDYAHVHADPRAMHAHI